MSSKFFRVNQWKLRICSLCGSDELAETNENDARCARCGEWMNTDEIIVVHRAALFFAQGELARWARHYEDVGTRLDKIMETVEAIRNGQPIPGDNVTIKHTDSGR